MYTYRADDVQAAVRLAWQFKCERRYDWFRGQTHNWRLVPSLHRPGVPRDEALAMLARFEAWAGQTNGLESLAADATALLAVAQHYGLPTPFIDFTTDPDAAGFFACDGLERPTESSCIICLDTADLTDFWQAMPSKYPPPTCVQMDVSNLWRLEVQKGTFLLCPYDDIERLYGFDRIFFPCTSGSDHAARKRMYPREKSRLEILLDQYLMNEQLIKGTRTMDEVLSNVQQVTLASAPMVDPDLVLGGDLPSVPSWIAADLSAWHHNDRERHDDLGKDVTWELNFGASPDTLDCARSVAEDVYAWIKGQTMCRRALVNWTFSALAKPQIGPDVALADALRWLWDGLRSLPYSDEDLALAIGNCVGLHVERTKRESLYDLGPPMHSLFGASIEVELDGGDGSYSRAFVPRWVFLEAVRPDIAEFLAPACRDEVIHNPRGLLQAIGAPDLLFEFEAFALMAARFFAPTQVLVREGRAAFFSPARIVRIGLP